MDDPGEAEYPMPALLEKTDDCYVGLVRTDGSVEHGIAFWLVADLLRKVAALKSVQIAEKLLAV